MPSLQSNVQAEIHKLQNQAAYVELFKMDATHFGSGTAYFTNNASSSGGAITFGGQAYQPFPIQAIGFDVSSAGTLPKPSLIISNVHATLLGYVLTLGDLVGAYVYRIRTYDKFLDGGTSANSAAYIGPEKWLIEQMTERTATSIQWTLTTSIDRLAFRAGRQILKDQSVKNLYAPGVSRTRTR